MTWVDAVFPVNSCKNCNHFDCGHGILPNECNLCSNHMRVELDDWCVFWKKKKRDEAVPASMVQEATVEELKEQVALLEQENHELRKENNRLRRESAPMWEREKYNPYSEHPYSFLSSEMW